MKKTALLLALALALIPVFTSCEDVSVGESSAETSEASEYISEEPSQEESEVTYVACPAKVSIYTRAEINRDEYVTCSVRIEDPSGKYDGIYDSTATIKVRGNSTSSGAKRPFNIKFSSKQDVLGMGECKKWYLLANMYDKTLIRNKLVYDFAAEIGLAYTQQSTFADLYLNGVYQGNYQICESIGVGESRVDIDTKGHEFLLEYEPRPQYSNPNFTYTPVCGILFGFDEPSDPTAEQLSWLRNFLRSAETALLGGSKDEISRYWDIDSFVDDYIVHEYFKCVDAQTSSTRYYIKDGRIYGGPVWDFDLSSGNANPNYYTNYQGYDGDSSVGWWCKWGIWYRYFFQTDWFEEMVAQRFAELQPMIINLTDDGPPGQNRIDMLLETYGDSFRANFTTAGWRVTSKDSEYERMPFSTYEGNVQFLRQWLRDRNTWMKSQWGTE